MTTPIPTDIMDVAASIEADIPSRVTGANRVFIRAVIARAILAEHERCANDPLKGLFQSEFDDALSETDIEDPRAAKQFAAEEAFGRLLDRLSDLMSGFAR